MLIVTQVVIENQAVGAQLLSKGNLGHRVTFIPLNKISSTKMQADRVAAAKRLAPGRVELALDLIDCEQDVTAAMNYVFGHTIIAKDTQSAQLVTFDKSVRARAVTYDGDVYDPSGQLSGGAKSTRTGFLITMQRIKQCRMQCAALDAELRAVQQELGQITQTNAKYASVGEQIDMLSHELTLLETRIASNPHFKMVAHVEKLKQDLATSKASLEKAQEDGKKSEDRISSIEADMEELAGDRNSKLEALRSQIQQGKKDIQDKAPIIENAEHLIALQKDECEQYIVEAAEIAASIIACRANLEQLTSEHAINKKELQVADAEYNACHHRCEAEKKSMMAYDHQLNQLSRSRKQKTQQLADSKLEIQQRTIEFQNFESGCSHARAGIKRLESAYKWIADQKHMFGTKEYDFSKVDMASCKEKVDKLHGLYTSMKRTVDKNVLDKYAKVEKRQVSLVNNLSTVKKDKCSIHETISYLDRKKQDKLTKTWTQVNRDFGSIFGDLLPGNTCQLVPPKEDFSEGLLVKVCLGKVWKQSLLELSGGQRSLVALSLILSLLQFNPAPMYILDEVDAALDLSHTQNIGKLLKTRFNGSQFILVSLKDGMYQNANCLFRTKFVDGVSKVDVISLLPSASNKRPSAN